MTPTEKSDLLKGVDMLRSAKKARSVTSRLVSSAARGIMERSRPAVLAKHGGPVVFSKETARLLLRREGFTVRARTSMGRER